MIVFCWEMVSEKNNDRICGVDDWVGIEKFSKEEEPWLRTFLELPNGIPSHDTFNRVFQMLEPGAFDEAFR